MSGVATEAPVAERFQSMTLREHIAAEEPASAPGSPAAPAAPVVHDEPIDAELEQEINAVEAPKAEETPAEKRARTIRNRQTAEKAIKTRLANARDRERDRADRLERELTEARRPTAPAAAHPATPQVERPAQPAYDGSDPTDPEPMLDQFGDKPDPFMAWTAARTDWGARREVRRAQHVGRQASMAADVSARRIDALRAFDTHAQEIRKTAPDFDAAIEHLELSAPMQAVIFGSGALGPRLAYQLAKDPATHQRLMALPPAGQFVELGALKASVQAAHKPAAAAPEPVTQAAPVPSATVGGAASAASNPDTRQVGFSTAEHIRIEEAELDARRARGLRN